MSSYADKNGKSKPKKKVTPDVKFRFVNHTLTAADKEWLDAADLAAEFPASSVDELVTSGYKFGLSHDQKHNTFVASLTDREPTSPFFNACLTGRGSTPADARYAVLYRHLQLASGDWSVFDTGDGGSPGRFG